MGIQTLYEDKLGTVTTNHTLKTDVHSLLKYGRENAVTGKELAKTLGYPNDRVIRMAIIRQL